MALWEDYTNGSGKTKELLENRYGCRAFRVTLSRRLSKAWIKVNTKLCPNCFAPIEVFRDCVGLQMLARSLRNVDPSSLFKRRRTADERRDVAVY